MTTTVVARLDQGGTVHEILLTGGQYSIRTSWPADASDKPLTRDEAMRWIDDVVRPCGGQTFGGGR